MLLCTTKVCLPSQYTKQELPNYQHSQNPTKQTDLFKKELIENFFSKANSLVDKILSCPRIKLSNSQTLILDVVETGTFLLDSAQHLRRKNADVPDIYFTLLYLTPLVYLRLWFWIRLPKPRREEAGSLSKSERQKLQRLYTQGGGAYGSVRNLVKANSLSVPKVRQFLHSKSSYPKFTLATCKFKRIKAFAIFTNEIWWMDFPYVDKLANKTITV